MDKIKLAQRTIALLSSMIESGECHTARSREMKDNALEGLEKLRIRDVVGRSEQLKAFVRWVKANDRHIVDGDFSLIDDYLKSL
jgi:hypothetical protein